MAKMFTIKGKKATQGVYLAHAAYENAKALVTAHNGAIGSADGKMLEATFKSNAEAKAFADAFENAYAKAHKAYAKAKGKTAKAQPEAKVAPVRKAEPRKPARAKGNSVDFAKFQGTKSEKNKALHAHLVSMGMKDSRTAEYLAIWNARPWAK